MRQGTSSLKILVVCQYYHPEPFRITDICESLAARGHEVTVITGLPNYPEGTVHPEYRGGRRRAESINGVRVVRCFEIGRGTSRLRLSMNYLSFALSATLKALRLSEGFDVVFVNQLSPVLMAIPGIVYKKRHDLKLLMYCLDLWPASLGMGGVSSSSLIYRAFGAVSRSIYRSADSLLVASDMFKDYLTEDLGVKDVAMRHLAQYAEDLFERNERGAAVDHPHSGDDQRNFVFAGNIGEAQSVETIVRAANALRYRTDVVIHVVGDGSQAKACRDLAARLQLQNVVFHGRRPLSEMPDFYQQADAMLITLRRDKFLSLYLPGKVQSYMAAGKPILGAVDGETRRVIDQSQSGYACAAEDWEGLARIIERFSEEAPRDRMGDNSARYYAENFSKDGFLSVLEEELHALAVAGARGSRRV